MRKTLKVFTIMGLLHLIFVPFLWSQNSILTFDGINDYVDLGDSAGNGVRTIEMWFKPEVEINSSLSDYVALTARETSGSNINEFSISFTPSFMPYAGALRFDITEVIGNYHSVYSDNNTWNAGQWYHVAAVVHPVQGMMLFIDGVKQSITNSYTLAPTSDSHITTLGCWGDLFARYFHGSIDDVRFSSDAIYTTDFTPPCPDQTALPSTIGMWNFNESSGGIAVDSSSNGYDGVVNGATWAFASVCQANALFFDGINDYVDLGDSVGNGVRTIEMWFKPEVEINSSLSDFVALTARETSGSNINEFSLSFQPSFMPHAGVLRFDITEVIGNYHSVYSDNNKWNAGQWYHIAAVVHPVQGMMLFIDGVKQSSTNSYTLAPASNSHITTLGCWGDLLARYFHGSIDDVRFSSDAIYTTDFTPPCPDQTALPSTIGMWNFNESSGDTAVDLSSNSNHGFLAGASRITADICGNALGIGNIIASNQQLVAKVFPNPSTGDFTFSFDNPANNSGFKIFVYNSQGKIIYCSETSDENVSINLPNNGIYFYHITQDNQTIYSGKLIKE